MGITGASEGKLISEDWMQYEVIHPGLTITVLEPYTTELMPISTIGQSSSVLTHTVEFGTQSSLHKLEIIGKYSKQLYLDEVYYGTLYSGEVVIKDGVLTIDGKQVTAQPLPK